MPRHAVIGVGRQLDRGESADSGEWDLLLKVYISDEAEIGRFVNEKIACIPGIERSLTTITFTAF